MLSRLPLVLCLSLASTACVLYTPIDLGSLGSPGELRETVLQGTTGPKLVLVEISGVISDEEDKTALGLGERPSIVAETKSILDRAGDDEKVAGLLLRIDSPGGSVSASDTLYHEIAKWKADNKKPVVAFFNGLSTSGAYYLAMAADRVVAHPAAVTGSIGVIMPGFSIAGLMKKYGVADQTLTSGAYKDAGSMLRDMRPEERAQLLSVIDDLYTRFREVVKEGRPALDADKIKQLADGRVYSAPQALKLGLVDQLGYLDDAVAELKKRANATDVRVVSYHRANQTRENIYSRAPSLSLEALQASLVETLQRQGLAPGFYYLWPFALPR
ncbi:MAG TPA: signal peptide peptidase SppA [Myxococcota bacterium]|nr:signal peptide peptidase SppA [Myxococcota bacterium]